VIRVTTIVITKFFTGFKGYFHISQL